MVREAITWVSTDDGEWIATVARLTHHDAKEAPPMTDEKLLTPEEAAERFAVSPRTIREWIRLRKLRAVRVGRLLRVPESAVRDFIRPLDPTDNTDGPDESTKEDHA
jgi:excisionase family DNA binding protein